MKNWKIALVLTLVVLGIGALYLRSVWKHRQEPSTAEREAAEAARHVNMDDYAVVRFMSPQAFADLDKLNGKTVWMKNGYTIPYFPYAGGRIDFAHSAGVVPSAQKLEIKKFIKSAVPASIDDSISHGTRQAFALFTLPGDAKEYALAVGALETGDEAYFCDQLFFYDDPHSIYDNWSKEMWAAVDARQVKLGMNELQTRMAIGQKFDTSNRNRGNRIVHYDQAGKKWTVTYVDNKATKITNP